MQRPTSPPAPFLPKSYQLGILFVLNCVLFLPSLGYEFTGLDDTLLIVQNEGYLTQPSNIFDTFRHDVFYNPTLPQEMANVYYRPLLTMSFMWDSIVGGQSRLFCHLTNVALHMANTYIVLILLSLLAVSAAAAFWGALFFAIHPVLAQAVCWVPGRNDSLLALFVLLSVIFFVKYIRTQKPVFLLSHVLSFAFGLFTKETAIAVPLIVFTFCWIYENKKAFLDRIWTFLLLYAVVIVPWFFLRANVVSQSKANLSIGALTESFIRNIPVYFQMVQKLVLPVNLSLLSTPQDHNYLLLAVALLLLAALFYFSRNVSYKKVLFGFLWFNAFLLPTFLVHILTGFEHRVYLPFIGFLIMLLETDFLKDLKLRHSYRLYTSVAFLVLLFAINLNHVKAFSNGFEFWKTASDSSPHSSLAKLNYGARLTEQGKLPEALQVYLEGININPLEPKLHNNIGIIYARTGKLDPAEQEFKKEIEINPLYSDAHFNLGVLYSQKHDLPRAIDCWMKALELNPNHERAKSFLNRFAGGIQPAQSQ